MTRNRLSRSGWFHLLRRCDAGSALVEMALTLPLLLVILVGSVELGDFAYRATEMTNAARAAAQYAAMNGGNYTDCKGTVTGGACDSTSGVYIAAQKDAPKSTATCTNFVVNLATSCTCSNNATACGTGTGNYACSGGTPEVLVTVTTAADCVGAAKVPYFNPFTGNTITLRGSAQQIVLN